MKTQCQTIAVKQQIVVANSGSRWSYQEETILSEQLLKNPKISNKALMEFLPGRTAPAIQDKKKT